jgi:hypothetical protein
MMNDAIELGLPTVIGTTFSVEADLVIGNSLCSDDDVAGVDDGQPAVAVTRDKNSGIGGAMPLPQGFHREAGSMNGPLSGVAKRLRKLRAE